MPLYDSLPPSRLPRHLTAEGVAHHFSVTLGVRVDLQELPQGERAALARARLPTPPEARLLDRVLQLVPPGLLTAVERLLIVDSGAVGQLGSYRAGVIRIFTPALRLGQPDPQAERRYSYFTTTVLHEIGHAVYSRRLTLPQRATLDDLYLAALLASGRWRTHEPSEQGAEHYFVDDLFVAALLGVSPELPRSLAAREFLRTLGIP